MDKETITFHLKSITEGNNPVVHVSSVLNILEKDEDKEENINILIKFANVVIDLKAPKHVEDCDSVNSLLFLVIDVYSRESRWSIKLMLLSTIERIFDLNNIAKFYRTFSVKSYNTDAIIAAHCGRRLAVTDTADQFPVYMLRNVNYLVHSESLTRILSLMTDTNNILPFEAMVKCLKICSYCQHMVRFKVMADLKFINYSHIVEYANRLNATHFKNSDISDFSRFSEAVHNLLNKDQEVKILLIKIAMVGIASDRLVIRGEALSLINHTMSTKKGTALMLQQFRFVNIAFQSSVLHNQTVQLTLEIYFQLVTQDCATVQNFQTILQLLLEHSDSNIITKLIDTLCQIVPILKYPMLEEFQKVFDSIPMSKIYHPKNEDEYKNNTAFIDNISKLFHAIFESYLRLQTFHLHSTDTHIIVIEDRDSKPPLSLEKDGTTENILNNKLITNNNNTTTAAIYDASTWAHLVSALPVGLKSLLLISLGRYTATSSVHRSIEQVVDADLKEKVQVEPMDTDPSVASTSSSSAVVSSGKRTNTSSAPPGESLVQDGGFPYTIPENILHTTLQIIRTCSIYIRKTYILPICANSIMTKKGGSLKHSLLLWLAAATDAEPAIMALPTTIETTTTTTTIITLGNFSVELFGNIWGVAHLQQLFDSIISELLLLLPAVFNKPAIESEDECIEIISLYFSTLFLLFRHISVILASSPSTPTLAASGISEKVKEFRDNCIDMIINLLFHDILVHFEAPYRKNKNNSAMNALNKKKKMILELFFQNLLTILFPNYHTTSLQDFIKQLFTQLSEIPVEYHGEHSLRFFVKGFEITHEGEGLAVTYGKMRTYYQYYKVFISPHFQRMFDFCWVLGDSQFESLKSTVATLALFIPESEDCVGDATTRRNDVINTLVTKFISLCKAEVVTSSAQKKTEIVRYLTILLDFTRLLTGECTDVPADLSCPEHRSTPLLTLSIHIPGGTGMRCRASPLHSFHALKRFIKSDQSWSGEVILDNSTRNINMNLFLVSVVTKDKKIGILVARNVKSNTAYNISLASFNNSIHASLKLLQSHSELYRSLMILSSLYHGDAIGDLSQQLLAYLPVQLPSYHNLILRQSMSLQQDMSWLQSFSSKPLSESHSKLCLLYNRYYDMKIIHSLVKESSQPMRISSRSMTEINFAPDEEVEVEVDQLLGHVSSSPVSSRDWAAGFLASGGLLMLINDASSIVDRIEMNLSDVGTSTSTEDTKVKIYQDMLQVSVDIIHLLVRKVSSEDLKESSLPLTSLMLNIIRICPGVTELPLSIMTKIFKDSDSVFAFLKQPDLVAQFQQALNYSLLSSDSSSQSHYIDILSTVQIFFTAEMLPEKQNVFLLFFEVCLSSCLSLVFGRSASPPTNTFGLLKNCFALLFTEVIQDTQVEDNVEETMKVEVEDIIRVHVEVEVPQSPSRSRLQIEKFVNNVTRLSKTILDNKKTKNVKKSKSKSQGISAPARILPRLLWLLWHSLLRRPCYDYHLTTSCDLIYGQLIQLISSLLPYTSFALKGKLLNDAYCMHKREGLNPATGTTSSSGSGDRETRLTVRSDIDESDVTVISIYYLLTIRLNLNAGADGGESSTVVDAGVASHQGTETAVADVCVISRTCLCNGIIIISMQNRALLFDLLTQLLCDETLPMIYSLAQIYCRCYEFDLRHLLRTSPRQVQYCSYPDLIYRFKYLKMARTGLVNQGNTCYMNSLLQQLNNVSKFSNQIINIPLKNTPDTDVLYQLQILFYSLQESVQRSVDTLGFCKSCSNHLNIDDVNSQQDCEEFMSALFSDLEGTLKDTAQGSLVQDTFRGSYRNVVRCHECGHESATEELFYNIDLDVKGKDAITASLLQLVSPEILQGDCAILCSNCQRRNAMTRTTTISSLADVVVMHLKRFEYDLVNYDRNKINAKCTFPLLLNMEPFMSTKNDGNSGSGGGNIYKLSGVIVHCGTAQGGHYYSYVRDAVTGSGSDSPPGTDGPGSGSKEQQGQGGEDVEGGGGYGDWTRCNDSMVDPITDLNLGNMLSDWFGAVDDFGRETFTNAYMLFYIRTASTESCDSDSDSSTSTATSWEVVTTAPSEEVRNPMQLVHSRNSFFFRDCLVLSEESVQGYTNLMQHSVSALNNAVLHSTLNQTIVKFNHSDIQISNIFESIFRSMILFLFVTAPRSFRENTNEVNFLLIRSYIIHIISVPQCCDSNCSYLLQLLVGNSNFSQSIWMSGGSSYYQESFLLPVLMKLCDVRRNDIQWPGGEDSSTSSQPTGSRNSVATAMSAASPSPPRPLSVRIEGGGEGGADADAASTDMGFVWFVGSTPEDSRPTCTTTAKTLPPSVIPAKEKGYCVRSTERIPRKLPPRLFSDNITLDNTIIKDVSVSVADEEKSDFNIFVDSLLFLLQLEAERSEEPSSTSKQISAQQIGAIVLDLSLDDSVTEIPPHSSTGTTASVTQLENIIKLLLHLSKSSENISNYFIQSGIIHHLILLRYDSVRNYYHVFQLLQLLFSTSIISQVELEEKISPKRSSSYLLQLWYVNSFPSETTIATTSLSYYSLSMLEISNIMSVHFIEKLLLVNYAAIDSGDDCVAVPEDKINCYCEDIWLFLRPMFGGYYNVDIRRFVNMLMHVIVVAIPVNTLVIQDAAAQNTVMVGCELLLVCCSYQLDVQFSEMNRKINLVEYTTKILVKLLLRLHPNSSSDDDDSSEAACVNFIEQLPSTLTLHVLRHKAILIILGLLKICKDKKDLYYATASQIIPLLSSLLPDIIWSCCSLESENHKCKFSLSGIEHMKLIMNCIDAYIYERDEEYLRYQRSQQNLEIDPHRKATSNESITRKRTLSKTLKSPTSPSASRNRGSSSNYSSQRVDKGHEGSGGGGVSEPPTLVTGPFSSPPVPSSLRDDCLATALTPSIITHTSRLDLGSWPRKRNRANTLTTATAAGTATTATSTTASTPMKPELHSTTHRATSAPPAFSGYRMKESVSEIIGSKQQQQQQQQRQEVVEDVGISISHSLSRDLEEVENEDVVLPVLPFTGETVWLQLFRKFCQCIELHTVDWKANKTNVGFLRLLMASDFLTLLPVYTSTPSHSNKNDYKNTTGDGQRETENQPQQSQSERMKTEDMMVCELFSQVLEEVLVSMFHHERFNQDEFLIRDELLLLIGRVCSRQPALYHDLVGHLITANAFGRFTSLTLRINWAEDISPKTLNSVGACYFNMYCEVLQLTEAKHVLPISETLSSPISPDEWVDDFTAAVKFDREGCGTVGWTVAQCFEILDRLEMFADLLPALRKFLTHCCLKKPFKQHVWSYYVFEKCAECTRGQQHSFVSTPSIQRLLLLDCLTRTPATLNVIIMRRIVDESLPQLLLRSIDKFAKQLKSEDRIKFSVYRLQGIYLCVKVLCQIYTVCDSFRDPALMGSLFVYKQTTHCTRDIWSMITEVFSHDTLKTAFLATLTTTAPGHNDYNTVSVFFQNILDDVNISPSTSVNKYIQKLKYEIIMKSSEFLFILTNKTAIINDETSEYFRQFLFDQDDVNNVIVSSFLEGNFISPNQKEFLPLCYLILKNWLRYLRQQKQRILSGTSSSSGVNESRDEVDQSELLQNTLGWRAFIFVFIEYVIHDSKKQQGGQRKRDRDQEAAGGAGAGAPLLTSRLLEAENAEEVDDVEEREEEEWGHNTSLNCYPIVDSHFLLECISELANLLTDVKNQKNSSTGNSLFSLFEASEFATVVTGIIKYSLEALPRLLPPRLLSFLNMISSFDSSGNGSGKNSGLQEMILELCVSIGSALLDVTRNIRALCLKKNAEAPCTMTKEVEVELEGILRLPLLQFEELLILLSLLPGDKSYVIELFSEVLSLLSELCASYPLPLLTMMANKLKLVLG